MPVVFSNPGLLDIRAVQTMGLSVKETDRPIGYFGTGLKYAIATLLRNKNDIRIYVGANCYSFLAQQDDFRGQKVNFIWMKKNREAATPLGITTDLGKNWEVWMAMRELESNCRDERGRSYRAEFGTPIPGETNIVVSGSIEDEYKKLETIFLKSKPLWENDDLSIHIPTSPEQCGYLYYRGVRCGQLEKRSTYVYNVKETCDLTEDRTFKNSWSAVRIVTVGIMDCPMEDILHGVLTAKESHWEHALDYKDRWWGDLPEPFVKVVSALGGRAQESAWMVVRLSKNEAAWNECELTTQQTVMLEKAKHFIARMGETEIARYPIKVSADLGANRLGTALRTTGEIWLSKRVFEMGFKQLVSCLYEEYIHLNRGLADNCYEMQSFLFDKVIELAAQSMGEVV